MTSTETEGAAAALDEAFTTLGLNSVCSLPQADNPRSGGVAERLGMRRIRTVDIALNEWRGAVTAVLYEIDAGDWLSARRYGQAR